MDEDVELETAINKMTINENNNNNNNNSSNYDSNWLKGTSAESILNSGSTSTQEKDNYSHPIYKTISKLNGKINNMSNLELSKCLKELKLDPSGKKEILIKRLKNYHKQLNLNRENLIKNSNKIDFDYICVIDFEATCDDVNRKEYPHEIIEFPIVLINVKTMLIEDSFQRYVKPVINPILSKFCIHLTGIQQSQVENANTFPDVLNEVNEWILKKDLGTKYKYTLATDGPWDFENFLNLQCEQSGLQFPYWARRWVDVRKLFANWFNVRRCGIEKMLNYLGLEFEGQQHCGLDDAKNISRILIKLINDGCELKINERIRNCRCIIEKSPFNNKQKQIDDELDQSNIEMNDEINL